MHEPASADSPGLSRLGELERLSGVWSGTATICASSPYSNGATLSVSYVAQLDLAGRVLLGREVRRRGDRIVYQGLTVLGWDTARSQFSLHLFDSAQKQVLEPAFGEWNENTLTLDQPRREGQRRYSYLVEDENHCALRIFTWRAEQWVLAIESRWARHGQ
jgi:hypothetical protein